MFQQVYDPVGGSLLFSSLFAALPLVTMFVLLGWLRLAPHLSALVSLSVCALVAVFAYGMPLATTLNAGLYGAAFSVLTVLWIILNAIWLYNLTVKSGHFAILKDSFAMLSPDPRIQAIVIAFSFGALIGMQLLMRRPEIRGFISVAPPANMYDFSFLAPCPASGIFLQGTADTVVQPNSVQKLVDKLRTQKHITIHHEEIPRANHFFENETDELMRAVDNYLDFRLDPACPIR